MSSVLLFLLELIGSSLLRFLLLNGLDEDLLVLEHVTLGEHVELVVQSLVNLSLFAELSEESSESSLSPHPQYLAGHSSVTGTFPLSDTAMSAFPLFKETLSSSMSRMDSDVLLEDKTVLDELLNVVAGSSETDFTQFLVVHPHSMPSALEHAGCESSL